MNDVKLRKANGQFESKEKRNYKVGAMLMLTAGTLFALGLALKQATDWGAEHVVKTTSPVKVSFHKPVWVEKREPLVVLSPISQEVMEPEHDFTPIEQRICDKWGPYECKVAIAVAKAEGLNHPADGFNINTNGSIDVGYFRINSVHFNKEGCSLLEVATEDGNIDCAYQIWQEQGWTPWVAFTNGSFRANL